MDETQIVMLEQWVKGQVDDDAIEHHLPGLVVQRWKTLREELNPSDLENACERFIQMEQASRITVEMNDDDDENLFR